MRTIPARVALLALLVASLGACDRRKPAPATEDTLVVSPPPEPPPGPPEAPGPPVGWNRDAGAALLVPGEGGEALVVVPGVADDSTGDRSAGNVGAVLPAEVALVSRAGAAGRAKATPTAAGSASCGWPTARLGPASGADVLPAWTVGFVGGAPTAIPLDSIEGASPSDSAALAATATRLAAGLTDDTARAFRSLPFTVRSARRFAIGDGGARDGLVAVLTRSVNQEAAPLSEQVLLVAERPRGGADNAPWLVAYHERSAGREETVQFTDVLAAATLGADRHVALVLARSRGDGNRYALLERTGDLAWRVRWSSVVRGC